MKTPIILMLLIATASQNAVAELSREQMLKRVNEMRQRIDQDSQQLENETRANIGQIRASAGDSPTVSSMRREMGSTLARISNHFRCLDLDVENNGGNTVVICGDNDGNVNGEHTTAAGNIVGAINTTLTGSRDAGPRSASGSIGSPIKIGPLGNPVNNSGQYLETNSNSASNTSLVEGDVNGFHNQSITQANGDLGDRTAVISN